MAHKFVMVVVGVPEGVGSVVRTPKPGRVEIAPYGFSNQNRDWCRSIKVPVGL